MQRRRLIALMLTFDVVVLLPVVLLLVFTPGRGDGRVSDPKADGPFPLPPGFELGTAIAAQQVEHQQPSDWTVFERDAAANNRAEHSPCLLYTSPSPRDRTRSRMPSSA